MRLIDVSTKKYPNTFTMVDDEDFEELSKFRWFVGKHVARMYAKRNYRIGKRKQGAILMHRSLIECSGLCVDHKNRNTLDNRKENLRACTSAENSRNCKKRVGGLSKYRGVSITKSSGNSPNICIATISLNRKKYYLGAFSSEIAAAKAYNKAARKLHGKFASLNRFQKAVKEAAGGKK